MVENPLLPLFKPLTGKAKVGTMRSNSRLVQMTPATSSPMEVRDRPEVSTLAPQRGHRPLPESTLAWVALATASPFHGGACRQEGTGCHIRLDSQSSGGTKEVDCLATVVRCRLGIVSPFVPPTSYSYKRACYSHRNKAAKQWEHPAYNL
jgi:catalase (peroxidase I)